MKCPNPHCRDRHKGMRYCADGVSVCLACAEMERGGRMLNLGDFCELSPAVQQVVGGDRQMIQEAIGAYDYLKDEGCNVVRG